MKGFVFRDDRYFGMARILRVCGGRDCKTGSTRFSHNLEAVIWANSF